jgi:hypothetical protein
MKRLLPGIVILSIYPLVLAASSAEVVYRETFATTEVAPISKAGWKLVGLDGRDRTADNKQGLSARAGLPADAKPVGSRADESVATGYVLNHYTGDYWNVPTLYFTDEFKADGVNTIGRVKWIQATSKDDPFRVAVRIEKAWFVTEQTFLSRGDAWNLSKTGRPQALDVAAAKWRTLKVGQDAAVGETPVELPAGPLTAIGLFADQKTAAQAFDTFEVIAR